MSIQYDMILHDFARALKIVIAMIVSRIFFVKRSFVLTDK